MKTLAGLSNGLIEVSTCDQWYMYTFSDVTNKEDIEFFGYNTGSPMNRPYSSNML